MAPTANRFVPAMLAALCICLTAGCLSTALPSSSGVRKPGRDTTGQGASPSPPGTPVTSRDGQVRLTVPAGWTKRDVMPPTLLALSSREEETSLAVIGHPKNELAEGLALQDYLTLAVQETEAEAGALLTIEDASPVPTAGEEAALQTVMSGGQDGETRVLLTVLSSGDAFYTIVARTPADRFTVNEGMLRHAAASFERMKDAPPPPSPPSIVELPLKAFQTADGAMRIDLPSTWQQDDALNEQATLQASDRTAEEYMVILSEPRSLFPASITLDTYLELLKQGKLQQVVQNVHFTDPQEKEIHGSRALQFHVKGEVGKVKVAYAYTLIDAGASFHQIIFWTTQQRMDARGDLYRKSAESFVGPGMGE